MKTLDWYFDYVSPYAFLQNARLGRLDPHVTIRRRPILFAGLLAHYGHLGPAEIAPKRIWTYRHCLWLARHHGIPMTLPTMHPFNPLPLLRLSIALGNTPAVVDRLFAFVWADGHVPTDASAWQALLAELGVEETAITAPAVKDALRQGGVDALAAGVFGVPMAVVDDEIFWGFDSTDMLLDYLDDPSAFVDEVIAAADAVGAGPARGLQARPAVHP